MPEKYAKQTFLITCAARKKARREKKINHYCSPSN
jgi:hypothetical protein